MYNEKLKILHFQQFKNLIEKNVERGKSDTLAINTEIQSMALGLFWLGVACLKNIYRASKLVVLKKIAYLCNCI